MLYTLVKKNDKGSIDSIISFDSISSMNQSWSASVSTYTVEKGFNISDNVNIEPEVYEIEAVISSYSIFSKGKEIFWDGQAFATVGDYSEKTTTSHIIARDNIIETFKSGAVLTLLESSSNSNNENIGEKYSELKSGYSKEIDDCVITSLSISHPSAGSGAFLVSLKLQKVYVATVETYELPEGVTVPLLTQMQAKERTTGSSASTTKAADGTDVAASPMDGVLEEETLGGNDVRGEDWFDGYNRLQDELQRGRNRVEAIHNIRRHAIATNQACLLIVTANGGYTAECSPR